MYYSLHKYSIKGCTAQMQLPHKSYFNNNYQIKLYVFDIKNLKRGIFHHHMTWIPQVLVPLRDFHSIVGSGDAMVPQNVAISQWHNALSQKACHLSLPLHLKKWMENSQLEYNIMGRQLQG